MADIINIITQMWLELTIWLFGLMLLFGALSRISPCNKEQPIVNKEMITDIIYCFVMPIVSRVARTIFVGAAIFFILNGATDADIKQYLLNGYGPLSRMPLWLQATLIFLISDFLLYWLHRWFHEEKLWKIHAIHHSPKQVDWSSTFRFHPVNVVLAFSIVDSLMLICGFSPASIALLVSFNLLYSAMVHANLNWTFGPFRFLFASPVFHRWHHTSEKEGMNTNFAPTIPLLDIMFGTFYMPKDRVPELYGVSGSDIPESFIGQMIWPFKKDS